MQTIENTQKASIVTCALNFAQKHLSKYTGFLHYKSKKESTRDLIPVTENILYAIALVKSLSKEKAEKGFLHFEKLFAFFTKDGFCNNLHEFPTVYSDTTNVNVFIALKFFLEEFYSLIPKAVSKQIQEIVDKLDIIIQKRELKGLDRVLFKAVKEEKIEDEPCIESSQDLDRLHLVKLLLAETLVLDFHKPLNAYIGSLTDTYYDGHKMATNLEMFLTNPNDEDRIALQAAVLPRKFDWNNIKYRECSRDDLHVNNQNGILSIHFANHTLWAQGDFEVKVDKDTIELTVSDFEDISMYFSNNSNSKVLVENAYATNFSSSDMINLITEDKTINLSCTCKNHDFTGILMRGNRDNQLKETKDFVFFDHKIFLRKIAK